MLNHYTWFLAEAHQAHLIESSRLKDTKKIWPTALSKTFQSTSKDKTYSAHLKHTSNTHINRATSHISTRISTQIECTSTHIIHLNTSQK